MKKTAAKKRTQNTKDEAAFKNISDKIVKFIAEEIGHCDTHYVRMLIRGDRPSNSAKARTIIRAAKQINNDIERIQNKTKNRLIVGEND